jgi:hypothetical protein
MNPHVKEANSKDGMHVSLHLFAGNLDLQCRHPSALGQPGLKGPSGPLGPRTEPQDD